MKHYLEIENKKYTFTHQKENKDNHNTKYATIWRA
jgi:hypothetical protein